MSDDPPLSKTSRLGDTKTMQANKEYVDSLNFEVFDIVKELEDKKNFAMTITSKRRTGKSVLLKNFCYLIKNWYTTVYVFSMSAHLQPDLFDFVPKDHVIQGFNEEKLNEIWNSQEQLVMKMKKQGIPPNDIPKVLILFDDIIGDHKVRHSETLNNFFILGRHLHFGIVMISQTISGKWGLPGVIRSNVDVAVSFFLDSEYDRDLFCEQYLSAGNKKLGSVIYEKITRGKDYQAIVVLNCVISQDITRCVKTFIAKEKLPKFKMGKELKKLKNTNLFIMENLPASGAQDIGAFLPKMSKGIKY